MSRWPLVGALLILAALAIPTRAALAHELCFAGKTPYCLNDPFSDYWEQNGALPVFGYPITAAANERNADTNQTYLTQWVERNRLEEHPENAGTPYRILLGLLGKERLAQLGRDYAAEGREAGPQAGCLWFAETGHNVCDQGNNLGFKTYWSGHGLQIAGMAPYARSLQLFGLPLTAPRTETNSSGDTVMTQWFERARFEWHPNNTNEFKVLLGLLGSELRSGPSIPPTSAPPPVTPIVTTTPTTGPTDIPTITPTGTRTPTVTATSTGTVTATPTASTTPTCAPTPSPYPQPRRLTPTARITPSPCR